MTAASLRVAGRARSLSWVLAALVIAGVLVNAYLAVVARTTTPSDFLTFSAFWSTSLVIGFGLFLPLEQELARLLPAATDPAREYRTVLRAAGILLGGSLLVYAATVPLSLHAFGDDPGLVAALGGLVVVSAGQFTLRGALVGSGRMRHYAAVLIADAALRVGFALAVYLLAAHGSTAYAWVLVAAIGCSHLPLLAFVLRRVPRPTDPSPAGRGGARLADVGHLLVGSLGAQLLLNGLPATVAFTAGSAGRGPAASFQTAFQLVRIPLFFAVPIQATIVPALVALLGSATHGRAARVARRFTATLLALVAAGLTISFTVAPWLLRALYGPHYRFARAGFALLCTGVVLYLGMVVITQALVAVESHAWVSRIWLMGIGAGFAVYASFPDHVAGAEWGLLAGAAAGCLMGVRAVLGAVRRAAGSAA